MQSKQNFSRQGPDQSGIDWRMLGRLAIVVGIALPALAIAADTSGDAQSTICSLLSKVESVLTAISIGVVTIAIIFAGYQIAFAHKRIAEVAPILIGGILIGAAGQIASTLLGSLSGSSTSCVNPTGGSITPDTLTQLASLAHSLAGYLV